jgi:hypothetical protein
MTRKKKDAVRLVSEPFVIDGKQVRLVAYDWRNDSTYAGEDDIVEVYQVTWFGRPGTKTDPAAGWLGNVEQLSSGKWLAAGKPLRYSTPEDAALKIVGDWIAYEKTLTAADYEKLAGKIIPVLTMPSAKPPPDANPRSSRRRRNPPPNARSSSDQEMQWGVYHPIGREEFYEDIVQALGRAALLSKTYDSAPVKVRAYVGDGTGGWLWGNMVEISSRPVDYKLPPGARAAKRRVLR